MIDTHVVNFVTLALFLTQEDDKLNDTAYLVTSLLCSRKCFILMHICRNENVVCLFILSKK